MSEARHYDVISYVYIYDHIIICCTKPLSTIQCNKTLCQDQLGLYYS